MTIPMILAPLFVLVVMTFVIGFTLAANRGPLLTRGEIRPEDVSLRQPNWPKRSLQVGYSFQNQFELPMLFYVLTILAMITKHADLLFVMMAWIFVVFADRPRLRALHQQQPPRPRRIVRHRRAWCWSIMWLIFIVRIMLGLP